MSWQCFVGEVFSRSCSQKTHKLGGFKLKPCKFQSFSNERLLVPATNTSLENHGVIPHRYLPPLKNPKESLVSHGAGDGWAWPRDGGNLATEMRWFCRRKWSEWTISLSTKKLGTKWIWITCLGAQMMEKRICHVIFRHAVIVYIYSTSIIYLICMMYVYVLFLLTVMKLEYIYSNDYITQHVWIYAP